MRTTTKLLLTTATLGALAAPAAAQAAQAPGADALAKNLKQSTGPVAIARNAAPADAKASRDALAAAAATAAGAPVARSAAPAAAPVFVTQGSNQKLRLVRSFDIPENDPAYRRLTNISFTYDSAIAAISLIASHNRGQAQQLLDQLADLQQDDGSLGIAYDTSTGAAAPVYRTGTMAWVGLAAATFRHQYGSDRYDDLARGAATWLLRQQGDDGLLRGGPDVSWVSTQNNMIASQFLSEFGQDTGDAGLAAQGRRIGDQVIGTLLMGDTFVQGKGDWVRPTDVQALGAMMLRQRGDIERAQAVVKRMIADQRITGRSVVLSSDPDTFNMTYAAKGPFTGFRAYADAGSPDVLWYEWTVQARVAMDELGIKDPQLAASMTAWNAITDRKAAGPLGADKTISDPRYNEFHAWPSSAAGSWSLLQQTDPDVLFPAS